MSQPNRRANAQKGLLDMSTSKRTGIKYVPPEAGEALWILGDQVTFKTDGERDGLTLFVSTIPPGGGPPPHVHYLQEEAHYVLVLRSSLVIIYQ